MSTYGADVEALRQLATTIDGGAGVLDDARTSVRNAYQSAFWSGPDAQQARGQWDGQLEPSLARTAQALRDAAATLRSNADAQERTSTAGGGTGGGAPVAPGGSAGGGSGNSSGSGSGSGSGDAPGGGPAVNVKNTQESSADNGSLGSPATEGSKGSVSGGVTYDPTTARPRSRGRDRSRTGSRRPTAPR